MCSDAVYRYRDVLFVQPLAMGTMLRRGRPLMCVYPDFWMYFLHRGLPRNLQEKRGTPIAPTSCHLPHAILTRHLQSLLNPSRPARKPTFAGEFARNFSSTVSPQKDRHTIFEISCPLLVVLLFDTWYLLPCLPDETQYVEGDFPHHPVPVPPP